MTALPPRLAGILVDNPKKLFDICPRKCRIYVDVNSTKNADRNSWLKNESFGETKTKKKCMNS